MVVPFLGLNLPSLPQQEKLEIGKSALKTISGNGTILLTLSSILFECALEIETRTLEDYWVGLQWECSLIFFKSLTSIVRYNFTGGKDLGVFCG